MASLFEVTHHYPHLWGGEYDIDQCLERWNQAIRLTERYLTRENHCLVRYEELVEQPETALANICRFMDVAFSPEAMVQYRQVAKRLTAEQEYWKNTVQCDILNTNGEKFNRLFDKEQQVYILDRIKPLRNGR
ncbi:sulfotransferase [Chloroflexi bacterium TSY]|nr:sulfotransferase [Chloroflexi bacterium TSY]